ncbi:MAG: Acetylglutamate kinase [Alphaproteobacteria bacterium MarineAlpha9_Bin4]|nr:acetylglutamate kinase [Pelagibacterales bacterium]PPR27252.1 MAG: Acetylglutamate kinase [Alphaproteobacteria bacterium MarineAlpha9_Bin4]|tara:strand:- start:356 stop:1234 length:879 start_codon:yes stop_codon:yes gene_type:complete
MKKNLSKISKIISSPSSEIKKNLEKYKGEIIVIKYGGSAMIDPKLSETFYKDIEVLVNSGIKPIIVHGGGPQINKNLDALGIKHEFYKGMRKTDKKTLKVVQMVLTGYINKDITINLSKRNILALGIAGTDGKLIEAKKYIFYEGNKKLNLGFVGKPYELNSNLLNDLLTLGIVPVIAPIGANKKGTRYNINADITAGFISHKISARRLLMLTDVKGVVDKNNVLINELKLKDIKTLISNKVIYGGMIPKVNTCIEAVKKGVRASVIIDGKVKHALLKELFSSKGVGTLFRK